MNERDTQAIEMLRTCPKGPGIAIIDHFMPKIGTTRQVHKCAVRALSAMEPSISSRGFSPPAENVPEETWTEIFNEAIARIESNPR